MKKIIFLMLLLTPFVMTSTLHAVAYPFADTAQTNQKDEAIIKQGTKLYLFHSGTAEVKNTIHTNDVLPVYREYPHDLSLETREVGKIKVLAPLGDYYFNSEVVEGEVKVGDLAKKGSIACFVTFLTRSGHSL